MTTGTLALPKAGEWKLDPAHTTIGFTARHLMVAKVHGTFSKYEAKITIGANPADSSAEATIYTDSVNTGQPQRDGHLKSPDFFDSEKYPTMTFKSTKVEQIDDTTFRVTGDFTIKDQTHPVTLNVEYGGVHKTPMGTEPAVISAEAEINRDDWGLNYNAALETGGWVVSQKVKLEIDAEIVAAS